MFNWTQFILILALVLSSAFTEASSIKTVATAATFSSFKSFRQWKNEKIQEASARLNTTKVGIESRKIAQTHINSKTEARVSKDIKLTQLQAQMRLDLISMELAKDLTVTDYFVGYVNKIQEKKEFINEIAAKMSPDEVAELMTAYAQSLFGNGALETPKCASNQDSKNPSK